MVIGGDGSLTGANLFRKEWPELLAELVKQGKRVEMTTIMTYDTVVWSQKRVSGEKGQQGKGSCIYFCPLLDTGTS